MPFFQVYDSDIRKLQWEKYIGNYCIGTKRYLLNEDLANLPVARQKISRWVLNGVYIVLRTGNSVFIVGTVQILHGVGLSQYMS